MPQNTITDLSNILFEQLERLNDLDLADEVEGEKLKEEMKRANTMVNIAKPLVTLFNTELEACKFANDAGFAENEILPKQLVCKTNG